jgi:hypothetical protein
MAGSDAHDVDKFSLTQPVSAPEGRATPENAKADAQTLGETSAGFLGAVGGMSLGAAAGPIGIILGGIAGAVGGWWAGRGLADALSANDDVYFRSHYEASPERLADRSYEDVRSAYVLGHLAGRNPDYAGRSFEDVEGDLQRGWSEDVSKQYGQWPAVRGYARAAFERARGVPSAR